MPSQIDNWKEEFRKKFPYLGSGIDGDTDETEEVIDFIKSEKKRSYALGFDKACSLYNQNPLE